MPLQTLRPAIDHSTLEPVYETITRVRQDLPPAVAFLGFCGAPWTLATYMIAGQGTPDQSPARLFAYRHPEAFAKLLDILVDAAASYLLRQFAAGVDAVLQPPVIEPSVVRIRAMPGEPEPKDPGRDHRRIDDAPQKPPLHHFERFRLDRALFGGTMIDKQVFVR
jgi:hypothetical protein